MSRRLRERPYLVTAVVFLISAILSSQTVTGGTNRTDKTNTASDGAVLGTWVSLILPTPAPKPKVIAPTPTIIAAKSAIVLEPESHTVLFKKNAHLRLPPASTTKIATAAVVLETRALDEIVTVPENLIARTPGAWMGLESGQQISVEKLLEGMLVRSGNDAAFVLAETHPSGVPAAMNRLAAKLRLEDTNFVNPIGFDDPNHYSSAYDLAVLADYALRKKKFAEVVATKGGSTNQLLGLVPGVNGVKTGYTPLARGVLVISAERDGHKIIVVVMGSEDRETEAAKLVEWVYGAVRW